MEEALKEACTNRVGEEGIGRQIAGNVLDLLHNEAIARIEAANSATPVCEELKKYTDIERVCSSAVEKLYGLVQTEGRSGRPVYHFVTIDDMLAQEAIEPVITSMETHGTNESIQEYGSRLLRLFAGHSGDDEHLSLIASARGVQAIFSALGRFPDSKRVHAAALGSMFSIQQACVCTRDLLPIFYTNLVNANALPLSLAALERHPDDYETVSGALVVIQHGNHSSIRQTATAFFKSHPNLRTVIENAVETKQRLHPDDIFYRPRRFHGSFCHQSTRA